MKVAIFSRQGDCFPNIISRGLGDMLQQLNIEHKIFYEAIPFLMRLLPFSEQPRHWNNNLRFRIYNRLKYGGQDTRMLRELEQYDAIILSECLPNAYWKNFLAIETLREKLPGKPILSYLDAFIENAPLHQNKWLEDVDHGKGRYEVNLCPSGVTEIRSKPAKEWRAIGINISGSGLQPVKKKEFLAVVDFAQKGYEAYRDQQMEVLKELNIKTIVLEGRYKIEDIRKIYGEAAVFFLAFPETFGLPIAECLACGTTIFTPDSGWPMSWRLDETPMPWGSGQLARCFKVYDNKEELTAQLTQLRKEYDLEATPKEVYAIFLRHYPHFYFGDREAVREVLNGLKHKG